MGEQGYGSWATEYYQLTPKGRKAATFWRHRARASLWGAAKGWRYGEVNVLGYFRKHKTQPRSKEQIWEKMEFGISRNEMEQGIQGLIKKGYLRSA